MRRDRALDHQLGFRSRNQDAWTDGELVSHELALADDIGDRFARQPARDEPLDIELLAGP